MSINTNDTDAGNNNFVYSGSITIDLSGFDTSLVKNMSNMFKGCKALTELDLSNFNTESITKTTDTNDTNDTTTTDTNETTDTTGTTETTNKTGMNGMFSDCTNLRMITFGDKFVINDDVDIEDMFSGCDTLYEILLPIDNNNTASKLITELETEIETETGTKKISWTYYPTSGFILKDDPYFKKEKIALSNRYYILNNQDISLATEAIIEINKIINEGTVVSCDGAFGQYASLKTIVNLNLLSTVYVENMNSMFRGCSSLEILDISNFSNKNTNLFENMFWGCSSLTTIYFGEHFILTDISQCSNMFNECTSLVKVYTKVTSTKDKLLTVLDGWQYNATDGYLYNPSKVTQSIEP